MNLEQFKAKYVSFRDADKIEIVCDHPDHSPQGELISIGKQPARRNILKNGGESFICRACFMKYDNPMNRVGQSRQTDEVITVFCPHPEHEGEAGRPMKTACYYGSMEEPYMQVCRSCSQLGHEVNEETRLALSIALKGVKKSDEFKQKLAAYWKLHPERRQQAIAVLLANKCSTGMLGKHQSDEAKKKQSEAISGREYTEEHCQHISEGRKKMLEETGGFTKEHRENISKATIRQYKKGFNPKLHHLSGWHESPKASKVFYRSSYEKRAYMILDADETVQTYETEAVHACYIHPEKEITCNYLIDLKVTYANKTIKYIEIKPEKWLQDMVIKVKIEAGKAKAAEDRVSFEVWTEFRLFGAVYNEKNIRNFVKKVKSGEI